MLLAVGRGRSGTTELQGLDSGDAHARGSQPSDGALRRANQRLGAAALAGAYTIAGGPQYVADLIVGLDVPTMGILLLMMVILLFMGAFMDWVGIVLLIIPVFLPIVQRLPIEEIGLIGELQPKYLAVWFGVLFCMNMQVSFLSPPFGPAAFYLKSVAPAHISLTDIFKGFLPFIGIQILALTVLLIWPPIIEILL